MSTDNPTPTPLASAAMAAHTPEQILGFFRSVIMSGEGWSSSCDKEYEDAQAQLAALRAEVSAFQPLLAKVEAERDNALDQWNRLIGEHHKTGEAFLSLRADLAEKEAEVENLKTGELILKEMVLSMNADLAAKEAALRKAVQDQFSPVVVKTIECLARELRKNIGVIDSPAMCVKCGFKIHAPTTGKVLSQCPECYNEMKTVTAALASRADKGGDDA